MVAAMTKILEAGNRQSAGASGRGSGFPRGRPSRFGRRGIDPDRRPRRRDESRHSRRPRAGTSRCFRAEGGNRGALAALRSMKVWFTPRARSDLEAIIEYLSGRNPQAARNIKRTLDATVSVIGDFPESGRLAGEEGVRVLPSDDTLIWFIGPSRPVMSGSCIFATVAAGRGAKTLNPESNRRYGGRFARRLAQARAYGRGPRAPRTSRRDSLPPSPARSQPTRDCRRRLQGTAPDR